MAIDRMQDISLESQSLRLPAFFPSVSSVKTNLQPAEYVELLVASGYPQYLVSAYDIHNALREDRSRILALLAKSKASGVINLIDSGNYESFWKNDQEDWLRETFHSVIADLEANICFCFDNQEPPTDSTEAIDDIANSVLRDQKKANCTVVPIVHGPAEVLPTVASGVASSLYPLMLAVPERALGEGIARARTVRQIRNSLNDLGVYIPLHLLGTGNPLSIALYAVAGADSFDGLEWCQTVVDHESNKLHHFQQWDLFREQTEWGRSNTLPFIQSVLMHNLAYYADFMNQVRNAVHSDRASEFLESLVGKKNASFLLTAAMGNR